MTLGDSGMRERLQVFAFFPYALTVGLAVLAQMLMWSYREADGVAAAARLIGGVFIWVLAFTAFGLGDRARSTLVRGGEAPWEKPEPGFSDRLLLLCLNHLGAFLLVVGLVSLAAIGLAMV